MRWLSLLPALLVVTLGCGDGADTGGRPAEQAAPESPAPGPAPQEPAPQEPTPTPPSPMATRPVPSGNLRGDAESGKALYQLYCVTCHGQSGKGDGPAGVVLDPRPADHTDAAYMGSLSDEHVYRVIRDGGASAGKSPLMAPWGGVIPEDGLRDLVAYVRTLSGT